MHSFGPPALLDKLTAARFEPRPLGPMPFVERRTPRDACAGMPLRHLCHRARNEQPVDRQLISHCDS